MTRRCSSRPPRPWSTPPTRTGTSCPTSPRWTSSSAPGAGPGSATWDQDELDSVRELRPRLRQFWSGDLDDVVVSVNQLLAEAHAVPQLVRHDEWDDYHLHATPDEAPLATRMAVEAAMAISDVIRAGELSRLRVCEYPGCGNVVVDLSRNRSKRYCEEGCGNRAAVAAYRARKVARPG